MTRDQHAGLFGALVIVAIVATAGGLAWWFIEVFLPKIAWARMAADFLALPGGVMLTFGGLVSAIVITIVGKSTEPTY
jgi:hypothetical protein